MILALPGFELAFWISAIGVAVGLYKDRDVITVYDIALGVAIIDFIAFLLMVIVVKYPGWPCRKP